MPPRARRPQALDASTLANPISQPPHSAGTPLAGLKFRLHPTQIPSIIEEHYNDQERWHVESYVTAGTQPVPLATSEYYAIDQGQGPTTECGFDKV
jgi:protein transport protein SEC24